MHPTLDKGEILEGSRRREEEKEEKKKPLKTPDKEYGLAENNTATQERRKPKHASVPHSHTCDSSSETMAHRLYGGGGGIIRNGAILPPPPAANTHTSLGKGEELENQQEQVSFTTFFEMHCS